jgi:hypothetical protein
MLEEDRTSKLTHKMLRDALELYHFDVGISSDKLLDLMEKMNQESRDDYS